MSLYQNDEFYITIMECYEEHLGELTDEQLKQEYCDVIGNELGDLTYDWERLTRKEIEQKIMDAWGAGL